MQMGDWKLEIVWDEGEGKGRKIGGERVLDPSVGGRV